MAQGLTGLQTVITDRRVDLGNSGTSVATDVSLGSVFDIDATDNFTLANPTNGVDGQKVVWRIRQDGVGSRVITLGANFRTASDVGTIVLSTAINTTDYLGAVYNEADVKWDIIAFTKGIS